MDTLESLELIHDSVRDHHPGLAGIEDHKLLAWTEDGYRIAKEMAAKVRSREDKFWTLQRYVAGFRDPHLYLLNMPAFTSVEWPGFVVAQRGGEALVHSVANRASWETTLPQVGDRLLSIDGLTPKEFALKSQFPFRGIPALESSWVQVVSDLLTNHSTPWSLVPGECIFESKGVRTCLSLSWKAVDSMEHRRRTIQASFGDPPSIGIERLSADVVWASIPSFGFEDSAHTRKMQELCDRLPQHRNCSLIVLDLRGNPGGSSAWVINVLRSLFGEEYYTAVSAGNPRVWSSSASWRLSRENVERLRSVNEEILGQVDLGDFTSSFVSNVVEQAEAAFSRGEELSPPSLYRPVDNSPPAKNPVSGRVVVVTDGNNASAALEFMDYITGFENVVQVGYETSADTRYGDCRQIDLGDEFILGIPTCLWLDRYRADLEPYKPDLKFDGDIWNTDALRRWLSEELECKL